MNYSQPLVTGKGYPVDTVASFICNNGYNISGSPSSICQSSGNWNQQTPICNQGNIKYSVSICITLSLKQLSFCNSYKTIKYMLFF